MSTSSAALPSPSSSSHSHWVEQARLVIRQEGEALLRLAERIGPEIGRAAELICGSSGSLIVTGMGKAGLIAQKIAATFASTGTPSHFLHPAEAVHGDLGKLAARDVLLTLSLSGRTEEVLRVVEAAREMATVIVAVTSSRSSLLGRSATVCLELGTIQEACPLGLAPSTSTTAMLAVGDALAFLVSSQRGFGPMDFARLHPAGSLGRRLAMVDQVMRPLEACRLAHQNATVRELLMAQPGRVRRTGAVMILDDDGRLAGIFTDSDLARLLAARGDSALAEPIASVMTRQPISVRSGCRVHSAVDQLIRRKISELPVLDEDGRPVGLIDITDVLEYLPQQETPDAREEPTAALPLAGSHPRKSAHSANQPPDPPQEGPYVVPFSNR